MIRTCDDLDDTDVLEGRYGAAGRRYGKQARWHRPVAWMLALVMGIGMVALAFAAVYRGASSGSQDQVPAPASTGLEQGRAASPAPGPPPPPTTPSRPSRWYRARPDARHSRERRVRRASAVRSW